MNDEEFVRSKFPDAQICWKSRGWHIFVGKPTEVEEAHKVLAGLESLWIGDVVSFDPPLAKPVVDALYLLLRNVNKGWQIDPGEDTRTFWQRLFSNDPCDFAGNPIPQTISKITRIR